jgi:hypothetical protein
MTLLTRHVQSLVGSTYIPPNRPIFVLASFTGMTFQEFMPGPAAAMIDDNAGTEWGSSVTIYTVLFEIKTLSRIVKPKKSQLSALNQPNDN